MNVEVRGTATIDWWYPKIYEQPDFLTVDLLHTRSSDGIRIHYSSERDGWCIEQEDDDGVWAEVVFLQAWARNKRMREAP